MMHNNMSQREGFTIIELLVVIAIIGVLSSIIFPSLSVARARARDANRVAQMRQVQLALELYYDDFGEYPVQGCPSGVGCGCASFYGPSEPVDPGTYRGPIETLVDGGYLSAIPYDPLHSDPCYQYQDNYTEPDANLCGGVALPLPNYVILFEGETDISHEYTEWVNGSGYRCVSP